jgi:hypothetical protein
MYHEHVVVEEGHVRLSDLVHDVLRLALQDEVPPMAHETLRPARTDLRSQQKLCIALAMMAHLHAVVAPMRALSRLSA